MSPVASLPAWWASQTPLGPALLSGVWVNEIGLKSLSILWGGWTFGTSTTFALFQTAGRYPSRMEELNIAHTGCDVSPARSCSIQFGIPSGPGALVILAIISFLATFSSEIMLQDGMSGVSSIVRGLISSRWELTQWKKLLMAEDSCSILPSNKSAAKPSSSPPIEEPLPIRASFHQSPGFVDLSCSILFS